MASTQNTVRRKIAISRALRQQMASAGSRVVKGLREAANGADGNGNGRHSRVAPVKTQD